VSSRQPQPPSYPPGEGRQVLIVEDELRLREMLTRAVQEMGFSPTAAPNAEAALRLLDGRAFDILVVDLNLPGMGGLQFLEQARARWPATQGIVLTGFGDLDAAKQAIRLDVADFLTKPAPLGELEVALDRARNRRLQAGSAEPPRPHLPVHIAEGDEDDEDEEVAPPGKPAPGEPTPSLEEMEQRHILAVLEKNHGNRTATAAELGISLRKLYYRLGQYQKQGLIP
jgi:DNA-binding NtrC family response regulator